LAGSALSGVSRNVQIKNRNGLLLSVFCIFQRPGASKWINVELASPARDSFQCPVTILLKQNNKIFRQAFMASASPSVIVGMGFLC
jgi:hypothetical protein